MVKSQRASQAEKDRAAELRALGWGYKRIAKELDRCPSTIAKWVNPEYRERRRLYNKEWRKKVGKEHIAKTKKDYLQTEQGGTLQSVDRSMRSRELEADWIGLHPADQQLIINLTYCVKTLNAEAGFNKYHLDHIYPICKGGLHDPFNLRIITAEENLAKGGKVREEDWNCYVGRVSDMFMNPWMYNWG